MRYAALLLGLAAAAPLLAAETSPVETPEPAKEKLICKREVPIGSLIASRKMCLTKDQWRKRQDDGNATARNLVEDGASACGQNGGVCPF